MINLHHYVWERTDSKDDVRKSWAVEPGNEAGEWRLGMRLESGDWEYEAGEWRLGMRLESGDWEYEAGEWRLGMRLESGDWEYE